MPGQLLTDEAALDDAFHDRWPEAIAELRSWSRDSGANDLLLVFSFGDLALERAMHSMQLFVREGMPALRSA